MSDISNGRDNTVTINIVFYFILFLVHEDIVHTGCWSFAVATTSAATKDDSFRVYFQMRKCKECADEVSPLDIGNEKKW